MAKHKQNYHFKLLLYEKMLQNIFQIYTLKKLLLPPHKLIVAGWSTRKTISQAGLMQSAQ
jgi:hypothetical protein